ncbi:MAG TPA: STAS domain-containing protein [Solirubrobacteraceae bacterium]|nr:STAS domain-containing protein [Solirubrobacteraceae bacterium]
MVRPTRFEITQKVSRSTVTLSLLGELDMSTVPQLSDRVRHQLRDGANELTLDLRELAFMDSSGLRLLIELFDDSRRDGWTLRLIAPRHEAATLVLRATGADVALPFQTPPTS